MCTHPIYTIHTLDDGGFSNHLAVRVSFSSGLYSPNDIWIGLPLVGSNSDRREAELSEVGTEANLAMGDIVSVSEISILLRRYFDFLDRYTSVRYSTVSILKTAIFVSIFFYAYGPASWHVTRANISMCTRDHRHFWYAMLCCLSASVEPTHRRTAAMLAAIKQSKSDGDAS